MRNLSKATKIGAEVLGPLLEVAGRNGTPWGLHVEVAGRQVVYGDWPLLQVSLDERARQTPLSRLRAQWREEDGPVAALNNAIKIIHAFAERERAAA